MEPLIYALGAIVIVFIFWLVIRWALRWRDPTFSSEDKQAQANLWSKRRSGPGR